jgi:hypothetical protein
MSDTSTVIVSDNDSLLAEIARLKAENQALQATKKSGGKLTCKVSTKGALSVYGLGRWPITLYKSQWKRLLGFVKEIEAFIEANNAALTDKAEAVEVSTTHTA